MQAGMREVDAGTRPAGVERRPPPARRVHVGIGAVEVSGDRDAVLTAILGSCVGLVMIDRRTGRAGLAHVMLPDSASGAGGGLPGKFADEAVPVLLGAMRERGSRPADLACAIAGGADIFGIGGVAGNIGARNVEAIDAALARVGLRASRREVGGDGGRLVEVWVGPAQVVVRRPGAAPGELALLTP